MRQTPAPRPSDAAPALAHPVSPARPTLLPGGSRVLQNRRAPAQLSLFARALPAR